MLRRIFGVIAMTIGVLGIVGSVCALAGMFEVPTRRGPLGLVFISGVFLYVGWNWIQDKTAK